MQTPEPPGRPPRVVQQLSPTQYILEVSEVVRPGHTAQGRDRRRVLVREYEKVEFDGAGNVRARAYALDFLPMHPGCRNSAAHIHSFNASYHACANSVSLTNHSLNEGYVLLEDIGVLGDRMGTYLMNRIVGWAQNWPEADVWPINLRAGQALGENKERRNRFYEQFGIAFDFVDPLTRVSGQSRPMKAGELKQVGSEKYRNIEVLPLDVFLGDTATLLRDLQSDVQRLERANSEFGQLYQQMITRPVATAARLVLDRWRHFFKM